MNISANKIDLVKLIHGPHMTEKSYKEGSDAGQYVFKVDKSANKSQIKEAVESFFNVKVKSVNTLNQNGKTKSFKQKQGKRKDWKKAYVHLEKDHELDFIGAAE